MIQEIRKPTLPGVPMVLAAIVLFLLTFVAFLGTPRQIGPKVLGVLSFVAAVVIVKGLFVVNPNEAKVLQFFGSYSGTARTAGPRWATRC